MRNERFQTGVYSITHTESKKVYIGSAVNFDARWRVHRSLLRKRAHHSPHLQSAWDKYGATAFEFKKLLICDEENLLMYEQAMIDGHRSYDRLYGYNARPVAESMLGYRHTPEAKQKVSRSSTGRKASAETKALLSSQRKGRKMPDGFSESVSKRMKGFKHSAETRAVISAKGIGRPMSLHTREKKSKITFEQVEQIKAMYASGAKQKQIAAEFSLDQSTVSLIVNGKRWAIVH